VPPLVESETVVSRRTERVASLIRTLVAEALLNRLADPRIPPITSIIRVDVAADFSTACLHVSVMAPEPRRQLALAALQSSAGLLRRLIAPELSLRKIPELRFVLDDSLRRSFETIAAIDDAMRELGEPPVWEQDDDADDAVAEDEHAAGDGVPPHRGEREEDA
jgi:ribosome-binding factor A